MCVSPSSKRAVSACAYVPRPSGSKRLGQLIAYCAIRARGSSGLFADLTLNRVQHDNLVNMIFVRVCSANLAAINLCVSSSMPLMT